MTVPTFKYELNLTGPNGPELIIDFVHGDGSGSVDIFAGYGDGALALLTATPTWADPDVHELVDDLESSDGRYVHQFRGEDAMGWPAAGVAGSANELFIIAMRDHDDNADYSVTWYYAWTGAVSLDYPKVFLTHAVAERLPIPSDQTALRAVLIQEIKSTINSESVIVGSGLKLTIYPWDTDYATTIRDSIPIVVDVLPEHLLNNTWQDVFVFSEPVTVTPGAEYLFVIGLDDTTKGSDAVSYKVSRDAKESDITSWTVNGDHATGDKTISVTNGDGSTGYLYEGSKISFGTVDSQYINQADIAINAAGTDTITIEPGIRTDLSNGDAVNLEENSFYDGTEIEGKRLLFAYGNWQTHFLPAKNDNKITLVDCLNPQIQLELDPVSDQFGIAHCFNRAARELVSKGRTLITGRDTSVPQNSKFEFEIPITALPQATAIDLWQWWQTFRFNLCYWPETEAEALYGGIFTVRWISGPPEYAEIPGNRQISSYRDVNMVLRQE